MYGLRIEMLHMDAPGRRWWARAVSAASALALHGALIAAFSMGASAGKRPQQGGSSTYPRRIVSAEDDAVSVIMIVDPTAPSVGQGIAAPPTSLRAMTSKDLAVPRLIRISVDRLPLPNSESDGNGAATATTSVDGVERALLFGRYIDQIDARIQRAWVRPHGSPGGQSLSGLGNDPTAVRFKCRVQIEQSASGRVLEVALISCDSNPQWQQSLVDAIDAASPLPAPPSRSVFARSLVLNFASVVPAEGPLVPSAAPVGTSSGVR